MKILWFTWKDLRHPQAGGAEVVNEELAKRLAKDGHEVTIVTGGFAGGAAKETHPDGYHIVRLGNRYSLYYKAYRYYKQHLQGWADLVIDEVNTVPFFTKLYVREPSIVFAHMLCRQIWFHQLPKVLGGVGYLLEPLYLRVLKDQTVITVSESTKQDLMRIGFDSQRVHIISEGIHTPGPNKLPQVNAKTPVPTMLSLGAMRSMKRTLHQIKAFELAKLKLPELKLNVVGNNSGAYGKKVMQVIHDSPYADDITYHGHVTAVQKAKLLQDSHVLAVTSVKEGWGLVVTEANSHGTPAVVYNVDGLRDSVRANKTGLLTPENTPQSLADCIVQLLSDKPNYDAIRERAFSWSKTITFDKSYRQFLEVIK